MEHIMNGESRIESSAHDVYAAGAPLCPGVLVARTTDSGAPDAIASGGTPHAPRPRMTRTLSPPLTDLTPALGGAEANPIRIGFADKNPLVLRGLQSLFGEDRRFELVVSASDGERFLDAVARFEFDVGIIGWVMANGDGRAVLEALKALEAARAGGAGAPASSSTPAPIWAWRAPRCSWAPPASCRNPSRRSACWTWWPRWRAAG